MKKILMILSLLMIAGIFTSCADDASRASYNLSKAADMFEINRRVVFYNGITNDYILSIEGLCSIEDSSMERQLSVTCKTGANTYKKHFLGLSDNVTYFAEQLEPSKVNVYRYRVIFKPVSIIPDIDVRI